MCSITASTRRGLTYLDLLAMISSMVMIAAVAAPGIGRARERSFRIQCASNLRMIGQGMIMYAEDNKGAYPRVRYDAKDDAKLNYYTASDSEDPFAENGPEINDVTAAMFLLIRNADLNPSVFLCPALYYQRLSDAGKVQFDKDNPAPRAADDASRIQLPEPKWTISKMSNFPSPESLHYSIAYPYPPAASIKVGYKYNTGVVADFALAADTNPGSDELLKVLWGSPEELLRKANSLNHAGDGQNVLFNDGHMEWCTRPFNGAAPGPNTVPDNIYTYGRCTQTQGGDGIIGPPAWALDTVLLPTADQKPTKQPAK